MAEIAAVEAFPNSQVLTVGMSRGIQPALVIESRRIYHEHIAFPLADRVAQPCRLGVNGQFAAIRVYPVSYTHLDVYKRQLLQSEFYLLKRFDWSTGA